MERICFSVSKNYDCDVLVVGGGTAGLAAAISAARSGSRVILCESGGYLGGIATKGLVTTFMTCYDRKGENQIIKGIFEDFVSRMVADGGAIHPSECKGSDSYSGYRPQGHYGVTPFSEESFKRVAEQMCVEAGVRLLYHTTVMGCDTENNTIKCAYAAFGADVFKITAKQYIDASGNCSLASAAGAKTVRGNDDGTVQTTSMFFQIEGVDKQALDLYMKENTEMRKRYFMDEIEEARKNGEFPCGTRKLRIFENPGDIWDVNMAQEDSEVNEFDPIAVTDAEISQRKQIMQIIEFLRKYVPALKDIRLVKTASELGIRESKRIVGKTTLTADDILNQRYYEERIAVCANSMDVHEAGRVNYTPYISDKSYYIPLSCLISENIDNLMAVGKCLSADKRAFAAVRVMPPCFAMGEAAGVTVNIAIEKNCSPANVDVKEVQARLVATGAYL